MIKHFQSLSIVAVLCLGISTAGFAEDITTRLIGSQPVIGNIESINGSTMILKALDGSMQRFQVQPSLIQALKLAPGMRITVDGSRLKTGTIKHLDANTADIQLDGGNLTTFVITKEMHRNVATGDRIVITPNGKIVRADRYKLSAGDIRLR